MKKRHDFPWWYAVVKWGVPLFVAFSSATWFALCLTGAIAWPAAFAALSWTPGMFKVIDSLYAIGLVSMGMISIGSVLGFGSALVLRGLLLLPVLENMVIGAQHDAFESAKECEINKKNYDENMLALVQATEEEQAKREEAESKCKEAQVRLQILEEQTAPLTHQYSATVNAKAKANANKTGRAPAAKTTGTRKLATRPKKKS